MVSINRPFKRSYPTPRTNNFNTPRALTFSSNNVRNGANSKPNDVNFKPMANHITAPNKKPRIVCYQCGKPGHVKATSRVRLPPNKPTIVELHNIEEESTPVDDEFIPDWIEDSLEQEGTHDETQVPGKQHSIHSVVAYERNY